MSNLNLCEILDYSIGAHTVHGVNGWKKEFFLSHTLVWTMQWTFEGYSSEELFLCYLFTCPWACLLFCAFNCYHHCPGTLAMYVGSTGFDILNKTVHYRLWQSCPPRSQMSPLSTFQLCTFFPNRTRYTLLSVCLYCLVTVNWIYLELTSVYIVSECLSTGSIILEYLPFIYTVVESGFYRALKMY